MSISRRNVLKSGIAVAAVSAGSTTALASRSADLIIFDSRDATSARFASAQFARKIDVAHEDAKLWRNLRSAVSWRNVAKD
jgi:hypothetical protein